jgi:hypothetical protein
LRLCDLCLGADHPTDEARIIVDTRGEQGATIATGDLCLECNEAIHSNGLAAGIAQRFAERPRTRKRPEKATRTKVPVGKSEDPRSA